MGGSATAVFGAVQAHEKERASRPLNVFDIPEHLREEVGFDAVGMIQLDMPEEVMAYDRARSIGNTNIVAQHQLTFMSIRKLLKIKDNNYVVHREISVANGADEAWYATLDARVRELLMNAQQALHQSEDSVVKGFLKSRKIITL